MIITQTRWMKVLLLILLIPIVLANWLGKEPSKVPPI